MEKLTEGETCNNKRERDRDYIVVPMSASEFSTSFSNHSLLGTLLSASINSTLAPSTSWSLKM